MSTLVTVVVPTYRRPQLLDRCLQALLTQNFAPSDYEIIIVDDGPEDPTTRTLVEEWQHRTQRQAERTQRQAQRLQASYNFLAQPVYTTTAAAPVPITGSMRESRMDQPETEVAFRLQLRQPGYPSLYYLPAYETQGPAAARNLGWRAAAGEIIAFTDDDTIPDANWLAEGVAAFFGDQSKPHDEADIGIAETPYQFQGAMHLEQTIRAEEQPGGVSGRVIVPVPPNPTDNERNTTHLERSDFVTANCFYRRNVLEAVGGFDERFATAWREDSDLYFTLRERGYSLAWAPAAVVWHPVRPERWGSSLHAQKKSFFNALLYKKHPDLYRRFIQCQPPWHYYGMLLSLAAGAAGMIRGDWQMALVGLALWAALQARFILRRLDGASHTRSHVMEMIVTSLAIPFLSVYWRIKGAIHWRVWFM